MHSVFSMSKPTLARESLPDSAVKALAKLGRDIRAARKRRGMTAQDLAERALTTRPTLARLENGDPAVSFAVVAHVLWALELEEGLASLADPGKDRLGTTLAIQSLPKRVRKRHSNEYDF